MDGRQNPTRRRRFGTLISAELRYYNAVILLCGGLFFKKAYFAPFNPTLSSLPDLIRQSRPYSKFRAIKLDPRVTPTGVQFNFVWTLKCSHQPVL
jgi:hypothetical protein